MWNFPGVHQCQRMVSISRANAGQVCLVSLKKKQRLSRTTSPELKRQFKWKQLRTTYPRRKGRISWKSRKATLGSGMACATAWTASAAACARCRATASVESSEACQH